jgi:hypothetical protein
VASAALAGALAASIAVLVVTRQKPVVAPPPPPPPPVVHKEVHWRVKTEPQGAMVVRQRDGVVLGLTPLSLTTPEGTGVEPVRIVLQGYAETVLSLDQGSDADHKLVLKRKSGRERHSRSSDSSE